VAIPYCFNTAADKAALQDLFTKGWQMWSDKIGKPGSNHRMWGFMETSFICLDSAGNWRPELYRQTVRVEVDYSASYATVGYISENDDNRAGRHSLRLHLGSDTEAAVAHQMGHIMDLVHEHQQTDRKESHPVLI
jgi:hypothetical protein